MEEDDEAELYLVRDEGPVMVREPPPVAQDGAEGDASAKSEEDSGEDESKPAAIPDLRQGYTTIGGPLNPVTVYPGDFVVHRDFGICQYTRIRRDDEEVEEDEEVVKQDELVADLRAGGKGRGAPRVVVQDDRTDVPNKGDKTNLVIELTFANSQRLILPASLRHKLSRIKAADTDKPPKLTRLDDNGRKLWQRQMQKARESAQDSAQDVLALYAARGAIRREPCLPDNDRVRTFEKSFGYEPTPDQLRCFDDVRADMVRRWTPMDRLICGDVGFGKTEIALRAIYRTVVNGRQVALLTPTVVLAAQHYRTLLKRMPDLRVSLLRGGSTQTRDGIQMRQRIANGTIDVVVGTHALLGKSVSFDKLGLLVVDEEQRFGVAQKEKMKAFATGIDVLTLTATPIPRTLQMSLSGIRDMSTLQTPPQGRKNVVSNVIKFDEEVLKEAIQHELDRQGQVFYIVPRIAAIESSVELLTRLLPGIRVAVAHGKMKQIEDTIINFTEGGADVLVATSVVENGLDLPNANTIIVTDPQMFGLSALYQLRGRVGRSERSAFGYFMYPANTSLSVDAVRRLSAIKELSSLGSGFELANRDLEIRGAGALMGSKQSGVMGKVGPDVYLSLLREEIESAQGSNITAVPLCRMKIKAAKIILKRGLPDDFLETDELRSRAMCELESCSNPAEIEQTGKKWRQQAAFDGQALPTQVEALLKIFQLHAYACRLGITEIEPAEDDVRLHVPGWSDTVLRVWQPRMLEGFNGRMSYDEVRRQMYLRNLGAESPARQMAVVLSLLRHACSYLTEEKENFGFSQ